MQNRPVASMRVSADVHTELQEEPMDQSTAEAQVQTQASMSSFSVADSEPLSDDMFVPECSIEKALTIIGGKWSFLILRELYHGPQRFSELRRKLGAVSPKSLTDALRHLEEHGVLSRRAFATVPVTVEYSVTEKGAAFHDVLKEMKKWGALWG